MKKSNVTKIIYLGILLMQSKSYAGIPIVGDCRDHSGKYFVDELIPFPEMYQAGKINLFDNYTGFRLRCDYDSNPASQIEFSCSGKHTYLFYAEAKVLIHRKQNENLPRLAQLEIRLPGQGVGTINEIIPMVCRK